MVEITITESTVTVIAEGKTTVRKVKTEQTKMKSEGGTIITIREIYNKEVL